MGTCTKCMDFLDLIEKKSLRSNEKASLKYMIAHYFDINYTYTYCLTFFIINYYMSNFDIFIKKLNNIL